MHEQGVRAILIHSIWDALFTGSRSLAFAVGHWENDGRLGGLLQRGGVQGKGRKGFAIGSGIARCAIIMDGYA
jgi:hypothetical protein